jgi:hypothetical protein
MTARPRRQAPTDDLITAILQARGGSLPYRPDWYGKLLSWAYFDDPPVGAERIASMSPPFNLAAQLRAWREKHHAHERAHYKPAAGADE